MFRAPTLQAHEVTFIPSSGAAIVRVYLMQSCWSYVASQTGDVFSPLTPGLTSTNVPYGVSIEVLLVKLQQFLRTLPNSRPD